MNKIALLLATLPILISCGRSASTAPVESSPETVSNPLLWADVPDPDVIRVGDTFYLVSTTMHLMPGGPVYTSRDLVHWRWASYLFDTLTDSPLYDLDGGTSYGRGQWATSLRYHDGTFYALFCTNDPYNADSYIFRTDDPHHGWTLHARLKHLHDPSLFFDDDGRVYVFYNSGSLIELRPDLTGILEGGIHRQVIVRDEEENGLLEGSRVIKKDGVYYALMISWPHGKPRRQLCYRADSITGPYEKRVILEDNFAGFPYVGQGTIVDTPSGDWYGIIFQDRDAIGRVLTIEPCQWTDGWPMLGVDGKVPAEMPVPVAGGGAGEPLVVSDDFEADTLVHQWQWNHNPVRSAWSLTERPGWLRLTTSRVVGNLYEAPNTLSQRMEGPACTATACLDISGMKDGDRAGLAAFNGHSGVLVVEREQGRTTLAMQAEEVTIADTERPARRHAVARVDVDEAERVAIDGNLVYLRIDGDFRLHCDTATFAYSQDGHEWHPIGRPFRMRFDYKRLFMGTRYALFNYATRQAGGHVDVDYFIYKKQDP